MDSSESVVRTPETVSHNRLNAAPNLGESRVAPESGPSGEMQSSGGSQAQAVTTPVATQLPPIATDPQVASPLSVGDSPLVAADDEVIEQEWVQKAKKIVAETKDDPYAQEKEVGKLQAEYIKKRYGKDIKLVGD